VISYARCRRAGPMTSTARSQTACGSPGILVPMTLRLGFWVLSTLGCGQLIVDEPITDATDAAPLQAQEPGSSEPIESCTVAPELRAQFQCFACVAKPMPHCIDRPIPERTAPEPSSCANPQCQQPDTNQTMAPLISSCTPGDFIGVQGTCADGKAFIASLGLTGGYVRYIRDGSWVGSARYSPMVGACECGGESFSGDALCAEPSYEVVCGSMPTALFLPFADGKRAGLCLCAD